MLPIQAMDAAGDSGDSPQRKKRRDGRALAQFYDRYGRLVYALILRIVRDRAAAEDLVEETFLRVWNRAHSFEAHKGAVVPWLLTVARNRAIGYVRSQEGPDSGPAVCGETEDPRLYAGLEAGIPFPERARRVKQALAQLPENQRQAIELVCFDGLSQSETAARLGQPPDTFKTWVRDGLAALRSAMAAGVSE
ncbi:MAG TPA: sigma-70 family RNA polymerase sigma factor [Bryobacteraceae bacterium]|jgi:RNA polymerase sigma-70 factor (ECF subfamily)